MRLGAAAVVCAALLSCTASPVTTVVVSPSPAESLAADLRTHLDLLLGEHVMMLAKQSAAAVDHADDYDEYASLLATTATELGAVFASAFGNSISSDLIRSWNMQDGYLVDYGIGVVTHDDAKANAAILALDSEFVPGFASQLAAATGLDSSSIAAMLSAQAAADKTCIDDYFAHRYAAFYTDLHSAYGATAQLGDKLAGGIAQRFRDRFPGDPANVQVDRRVDLNLLLQEHAYYSTMATDAVVGGRAGEATAAANALADNTRRLAPLFPTGFAALWSARIGGLLAYGGGDPAATTRLTVDFVDSFATLARVDRSGVSSQMLQTLKVVDDQRNKDSKHIARDDRAAATAMQPIADAAT